MICNNSYLADFLRVREIKDLIWVMRFQSPLVYYQIHQFHPYDPLSHPIITPSIVFVQISLILITRKCNFVIALVNYMYTLSSRAWLENAYYLSAPEHWGPLYSCIYVCENQQGRTYMYANTHVRTTLHSKYSFFSYSQACLMQTKKRP